MLPSIKQWLVRVFHKGANDPQGRIIHKEIVDLGIKTVEKVVTMPTYIISGLVDKESIEKVCIELLTDPITQSYTINGGFQEKYDWAIEVWPKDGVTDFVAESVKKGLQLLNITGVDSVKTGFTYLLHGQITDKELKVICIKSLVNPLIHDYYLSRRLSHGHSHN